MYKRRGTHRVHHKCQSLVVVNMQEGVMKEENKEYQENVKALIESGKFGMIYYVSYKKDEETPFTIISGVNSLLTDEQQKLSVPFIEGSTMFEQNEKLSISEHDALDVRIKADTGDIYICGTDVSASVYSAALLLDRTYIKPMLIRDAFMTSAKADSEETRAWEIRKYKERFGEESVISMNEIKSQKQVDSMQNTVVEQA